MFSVSSVFSLHEPVLVSSVFSLHEPVLVSLLHEPVLVSSLHEPVLVSSLHELVLVSLVDPAATRKTNLSFRVYSYTIDRIFPREQDDASDFRKRVAAGKRGVSLSGAQRRPVAERALAVEVMSEHSPEPGLDSLGSNSSVPESDSFGSNSPVPESERVPGPRFRESMEVMSEYSPEPELGSIPEPGSMLGTESMPNPGFQAS